MSVFRQIVPNSVVRSSNERYEHLLMWLSPNGGVRQWLFSHTEGREEDNTKSFTVESLSDIRAVPYEYRTEVRCNTRFMDSETFDYVKSIYKSNRVYKVLKDSSKTPVGIKPAKTRKNNRIKNFEMSLTFYYMEDNVLNV